MKAKICIPLALMLMLAYAASAQKPNKRVVPSSVDRHEKIAEVEFRDPKQSGSGASNIPDEAWQKGAYLNSDWKEGVIIMSDGTLIKGKKYRYNLFHQQMQFTDGDDTAAIANPEDIAMIRIADRVFVYEPFICDGRMKSGYLELLEDGECRLLKRWACAYFKKTSETQKVNCSEDFFRKNCQCYLQFNLRPAEPVPLSKKDFVKYFGDDAGRLKRMMRKENLKLRREADVITLVSYYNSLHE